MKECACFTPGVILILFSFLNVLIYVDRGIIPVRIPAKDPGDLRNGRAP